MTLNDAMNKVMLEGHQGPHPAYNAEVFNRMQLATDGLEGEEYNTAFDQALQAVKEETRTPGTLLNKLATGATTE
jgi:hypothetical protein